MFRAGISWKPWFFALLVAGAALATCALLEGFTVDDALLALRYATHLRTGAGYRFNVGGPVTDGVTPLVWAPLLAGLVVPGDLLASLERAKALGLVGWTCGALLLGRTVAAGVADLAGVSRLRAALGGLALVVLLLAFPIPAWAVSGMETGIATLLATVAATSFARPWRVAVLAGLVPLLRPELVVWGLVLSGGATTVARWSTRGRIAALVATAAPFAATVIVRLAVFGRPAPLALLAKPSDLAHGLAYALAAAVFALLPLLVLAPLALPRAGGRAVVLVVGLGAHLVVVVAVGGDWMPWARLVVPIAPGLVLAHLDLARVAHPVATGLRLAGAAILGVTLAWTAAPAGRHVLRDRIALIEESRPHLAASRVVAALDVGWVAAATPPATTIVDLAGLTDPSIAALPGGHTSKSVDIAMLLDRAVDTVVIYDPPRRVERRITGAPLFHERFVRTAEVRLGTHGTYAIWLARRPPERDNPR